MLKYSYQLQKEPQICNMGIYVLLINILNKKDPAVGLTTHFKVRKSVNNISIYLQQR